MDRNKLEKLARDLGADFFGVADLEPFLTAPALPADLVEPYKTALSLGVSLSREVFENLTEGPTMHYSHHYQAANNLLDLIAFRLAGAIQKEGFRALPIPASQILDYDDFLGALSHKAVARMAGLGWQGKSLLLVNPRVGPRLRLVTVLTELDLPTDRPLNNGCGKCRECALACPAGAIKAVDFGDGYATRSVAWDMGACVLKLKEFEAKRGTQPLICGICIKACPIGRRSKITY